MPRPQFFWSSLQFQNLSMSAPLYISTLYTVYAPPTSSEYLITVSDLHTTCKFFELTFEYDQNWKYDNSTYVCESGWNGFLFTQVEQLNFIVCNIYKPIKSILSMRHFTSPNYIFLVHGPSETGLKLDLTQEVTVSMLKRLTLAGFIMICSRRRSSEFQHGCSASSGFSGLAFCAFIWNQHKPPSAPSAPQVEWVTRISANNLVGVVQPTGASGHNSDLVGQSLQRHGSSIG